MFLTHQWVALQQQIEADDALMSVIICPWFNSHLSLVLLLVFYPKTLWLILPFSSPCRNKYARKVLDARGRLVWGGVVPSHAGWGVNLCRATCHPWCWQWLALGHTLGPLQSGELSLFGWDHECPVFLFIYFQLLLTLQLFFTLLIH